MNRIIVISLVVICVVLAVGLVGTIANYTSLVHDKENLIITKDDQIANLQGTIDSLNHSVEAVSDARENPFLMIPDMKVEDVRPLFASPYLQITGHMVNFGTNKTSARIVVWAYQGNTLTFNVTIAVGEVEGIYYLSTDQKIVYSGSALTSWHLDCKPNGYSYFGP